MRGKRRLPIPLVVSVLVAVAALLFVIAHFASQSFETKQEQLAGEWFERGEQEFRAARVTPAIDDYRNALLYSNDNPLYRLRLAEALEGAGHLREARAYLLALWEQQPGDGTINLQLARLAARQGDEADALRYYHGAIYGVWNDNPEQQRRNVRLELINLLVERRRERQAEAELIQLSVDLPRDPQVLTRVGGLFLQVGDPARALSTFQEALRLGHNPGAIAGAGMAAFQLRRYAEAERLLRRATDENPNDSALTTLLQQDEFIVQYNPFVAHLSMAEKVRRVQHLFDVATQRLQSCVKLKNIDLTAAPPQNALQSDALQVSELRPRMRAADFRHNPDLVDVVTDLVGRIEDDTTAQCGPATGDDEAILLILRQREGS